MSVRASNAVWQHTEAAHSALVVMLAIADNADDHGIAWPSVKTIARKGRLTERAIQLAIRSLVAAGELLVYEGQGDYGTHLYWLHLPGLDPVPTRRGRYIHNALNSAGITPDNDPFIHTLGGEK